MASRPLAVLLAAGLAVALSGCITAPPPASPGLRELTAVPFFPQREYQCGPAALATVLVHAGVATTPDALVPQVFLPGREGSLQAELLAATRRAGRLPVALPAAVRDGPTPQARLRAELDAGRPVLVLLNLGIGPWPVWHYAVVVGQAGEGRVWVLRSGTERRAAMGFSRFAGAWGRAGHWGFVALRPGELPAADDPTPYLTAAAGFERVAPPAEARRAWEAATQRWPEAGAAWLGLGTAAWKQGEAGAAEAAWQRAARTGAAASADTAAAAHNNLASLYLAQRRLDAAQAQLASAAALPAVAPALRAALAATAAELAAVRSPVQSPAR